MGEVKRGRIGGKSYSSKTTFLRTGEETSFTFVGNFPWLVMIANLRITEVCSPAKATWDLPTHPPILTHGTMAAIGHTHQALSECRNTRPLPSESQHYSLIWRCEQTTLPKKPIDSSSCTDTFYPRIPAKHRKDWTMGWTWAMAQKNSTAWERISKEREETERGLKQQCQRNGHVNSTQGNCGHRKHSFLLKTVSNHVSNSCRWWQFKHQGLWPPV